MSRTAALSAWFGGLFNGSKQAANNPADDRLFEPALVPNGAGIVVTADTALKCSAVFRCVTILADIVSTLNFGMYRYREDGDPNGGMDPEPLHPIDDLIGEQPNRRHTAAEFWGMMVFNSLLNGEALAEIKPGPRGFADRLEPIKPRLRQRTDLLPDGTLRFAIQDDKTGGTRTLLQDEVLRIPGLTADGVGGMKTVELAADAIALLMAADQYAARTFSQNLNIGGFIKHPGKLSPEAGRRLVARLGQKFSGLAGMHRPMILQEGMDYVKASMTAQEAQLLDARKAQVREIANYFGGVPLHLLGVDDQTNRATVEEQWLNFIRSSIKPLTVKIQQAVRRDLILAPKRYTAKFDLDDLERGNMTAVADFFSKMLGSGGSPPILTQNEVRVSLGWNPHSEAHADELGNGARPSVHPPATQEQ